LEREFDLVVEIDTFIKAKNEFLADDNTIAALPARSRVSAIHVNGLNPGIAVCIYYVLPTGTRAHYSIVLSEIRSTEEGHMGYDGSPGEFHNVKVVQSFGGKAN